LAKGGFHLPHFGLLGFGRNLLDRFEAGIEFVEVGRALLFLQQGPQARAQGLALGQVDPALQGLEHPVQGPGLPMVEGDPVDLELAADFGWFAPVGPDRQDRLGFVDRTDWGFG